MRLLAQARNPYSRWWLWIPGSRFARPGMTISLSSLDEGEQVGVDGGRFRGRHAVRKALVGLQRPVLQQLCRQWSSIGVGNELIVVAVHYQHRHGDLLEVVGEIGLRESDDAVVMRLGAAHHSLPPPVPDRGLQSSSRLAGSTRRKVRPSNRSRIATG